MSGERGPRYLNRRNLLKFSVASLSAGILSKCVSSPTPECADKHKVVSEPSSNSEAFLEPEIVHGIEVYGLKDSIATEDQVLAFYRHFDDKLLYEKCLWDIDLGDKRPLRNEFFPLHERRLEVVVRKSIYDDYASKREAIGGDFVESIKMEVDLLNRWFKQTKPSTAMRAKLRRILVVADDSFQPERNDPFMDQPYWGWGGKFVPNYPIDIDGSWEVAKDPCPASPEELYPLPFEKDDWERADYFEFYHFLINTDKKGNLNAIWPPQTKWFEKDREGSFVFSPEEDSLKGKSGVLLNWGRMHEWGHLLFQTPDEYWFDIKNNSQLPFRFSEFVFATDHRDYNPRISSYTAMLLETKLKRNKDGKEEGFPLDEGPDEVEFKFKDPLGKPMEGRYYIYKNRLGTNGYYKDSFLGRSDEKGTSSEVKILDGSPLLEKRGNDNIYPYPGNWIIRVINEGIEAEVVVPTAAFNMSRWAGVNKATYSIDFTGHEYPDKKKQIMQIVDESDLNEYLKNRSAENDPVYAKMKVDGTSLWFIWHLRH